PKAGTRRAPAFRKAQSAESFFAGTATISMRVGVAILPSPDRWSISCLSEYPCFVSIILVTAGLKPPASPPFTSDLCCSSSSLLKTCKNSGFSSVAQLYRVLIATSRCRAREATVGTTSPYSWKLLTYCSAAACISALYLLGLPPGPFCSLIIHQSVNGSSPPDHSTKGWGVRLVRPAAPISLCASGGTGC